MAAKKHTARKKTEAKANLPETPDRVIDDAEILELSNPDGYPRRLRGVPVITKLKIWSPGWDKSISVNMDVLADDEEQDNDYENRLGAWLTFTWKWEDDKLRYGQEQEAHLEIEDGELFHLLRDHILVTEKQQMKASESKKYAPIPLGLLGEDESWFRKSREERAEALKKNARASQYQSPNAEVTNG